MSYQTAEQIKRQHPQNLKRGLIKKIQMTQEIFIFSKKCITIINVNTNEITNITNINILISALKLKKYI